MTLPTIKERLYDKILITLILLAVFKAHYLTQRYLGINYKFLEVLVPLLVFIGLFVLVAQHKTRELASKWGSEQISRAKTIFELLKDMCGGVYFLGSVFLLFTAVPFLLRMGQVELAIAFVLLSLFPVFIYLYADKFQSKVLRNILVIAITGIFLWAVVSTSIAMMWASLGNVGNG